MREEYERDLQHSWMILEIDEIYEEDYQMRMLADNSFPELLEVCGQGTDAKSRYRYKISGRKSLKELWEKDSWRYKELEDFMRQLIHILYELDNYLLSVSSLSLNPKHIFKDENKFAFCYIPGHEGNIWKDFHILTEEIVKIMDYEDKEGIYLAYELHKASMEEEYDIEQVLEKILEKKEKEMERVTPKKKEMTYDVEEEKILDDWAGEKELTGKVLQDRQTVWGFVSQKMKKKQL